MVIEKEEPVIVAEKQPVLVVEEQPVIEEESEPVLVVEKEYSYTEAIAFEEEIEFFEIEVEVEEQETQCVLSIKDNGPGIPKAELMNIFIPFRRLAEHQDHPGSGLGLYFTMHLIDREGGQVWAESKLGEGSRFCVALFRPPQRPEST